MSSVEKEFQPRIDAFFERIDVQLEQPESIDTTQRYKTLLNDGFSVELRAVTRAPEHRFLPSETRHIFISQGKHELCRPDVSVDLNRLVGGEGVKGYFGNVYMLPEIAAAVDDDKTEAKLVRSVVEAGNYLNSDLPKELVQSIEADFIDIIRGGSTVIRRSRATPTELGPNIGMMSVKIEGSLEHTFSRFVMEPEYRLTFRNPDEDNHLVLERTRGGRVEIFQEIANDLVRIAQYCKEEEITRDERGKIVGVSFSRWDVEAVIAAERATGLRDFKPEIFEFFESLLND